MITSLVKDFIAGTSASFLTFEDCIGRESFRMLSFHPDKSGSVFKTLKLSALSGQRDKIKWSGRVAAN